MLILLALDLFARWLPAALIASALLGALLLLPWMFADLMRRTSWPRGRWR